MSGKPNYHGVTYDEMISDMKEVFASGKTKSAEWRVSQLKAVIRMLETEKKTICNALFKDLRKDTYDSTIDEIQLVIAEAQWFINNIRRLMKDKKASLSIANLGGSGYVRYEPVGVVLNLTAWNYPLQLALSPLLSIVAAGNCCVIKPSELSSNTSAVLAELVPLYLDNECIKLVEGAIPETTELLKLKWDHIMYTGSGAVAKIILRAAAEHLTPCTLELGGKCPTYIDDGVDMEAVCNRVTWYKYKNAGQTCLAADYILIKESLKEEFLEHMARTISQQFGSDPSQSSDYCRIVNERHFQRLCGLLDSAKDKRVVVGGDREAASLYFGPTVITDISVEDKVMKEEIFGPILPVIAVRDHKEAIEFINSRDKPLHLNVFSNRQSVIDEFISRTSSGGFMANDGLLFRAEVDLPFGGVGGSGYGRYCGEAGFINFSHQKSVLIKSLGMEFLFKLMRYPPHSDKKLKRTLTLTSTVPKVLSKLKYILIPLLLLTTGLAVFLGLAKGEWTFPGAGYIPKVEL